MIDGAAHKNLFCDFIATLRVFAKFVLINMRVCFRNIKLFEFYVVAQAVADSKSANLLRNLSTAAFSA